MASYLTHRSICARPDRPSPGGYFDIEDLRQTAVLGTHSVARQHTHTPGHQLVGWRFSLILMGFL